MGFLEVSGLLFWLIVAGIFGVSLALGWLFNNDHTLLALLGIVGSVTVIHALKIVNFSAIIFDPLGVFLFSLGWLVIGILWSFYKWHKKLRIDLQNYNKQLNRYLKQIGKKELTDIEDKYQWTKYMKLYPHSWGYVSATPQTAMQNKQKISGWIIGWPFSILGEFVTEWIVNFTSNLIKILSGLYNKIANSMFSEASKDVLSEDEYEDFYKKELEAESQKKDFRGVKAK